MTLIDAIHKMLADPTVRIRKMSWPSHESVGRTNDRRNDYNTGVSYYKFSVDDFVQPVWEVYTSAGKSG